MAENFIATYSGESFDFVDPEPGSVKLEDVAHGLSMAARFGGQTRRFYSVARHSILVSRELERKGHDQEIQLHGLLHDAAEAYTGDIPAPLKKQLKDFKEMEREILEAIWEALGLEPPSDEDWKKVKEADNTLFNYEAREMFSESSWARQVDRDYSLDSRWKKDKKDFIQRFRELSD